MEDTKQRILEKSLELFSTKGYDAVSVGEIAKAVGIKAPSLYNHFPSKQAIFDAILETTSAHYQKDTAEISVHVQDSQKDIPVFSHISEELLVEKVRQIFLYSLHDKTISQFRRMMTLEASSVHWLQTANCETKTRIRWRGCMFPRSSSCSASATVSRNGKLKALQSWMHM